MCRRYLVLLLIFLVCLLLGPDVCAKGGRGGGSKGGGKGRVRQSRIGHPHGAKSHSSGFQRNAPTVSHGDRGARAQSLGSRTPGRSVDSGHPREMQKLVEDRKLAHRQKVADQLRQLSDRNGNDRLKEVADRMDATAQEHYERRMRKITGEDAFEDKLGAEDSVLNDPRERAQRLEGLTDPASDRVGDLDNLNDPTREIAQKLTGRENALYRQLRNEERKLAHRMRAAEQLRSLGELQGDEQLLQAADRLADEALSHYTQRLQKIAEFQDRFGLPTPDNFVSPALPTP